MKPYPLYEVVRRLLTERNKSVMSLAVEIDRSKRYVELLDVDKVQVSDLLKISKYLDFDFLVDIARHYGGGKEPGINLVQEPAVHYESTKKISIQITVEGDVKNIGKLLQTLSAEGSKQGYKVGSVSQ